MTADKVAQTASLALNRSPYSKGSAKLAAALEKPVTHTPGPWEVYNKTGIRQKDAKDKNGMSVQVASAGFKMGGWTAAEFEEERANAKLIAAAPELLEVLRLAESAIETPGDLSSTEKRNLLNDIRAALTLATGGAK